MAMFECSTTIKRPVEEVFAVLSDFSKGPEWSSSAVEPAKKTSSGAAKKTAAKKTTARKSA